MSLANQLALWADELRDLSAWGLRFSGNSYDQIRYIKIQEISLKLAALAVNQPVESLEPLRTSLFARPTPLCAADGAVIDRTGCILLVKRADNGKWAMPGGALEVGETPVEGVVREIKEETGLACKVHSLVGLFDSRRWGLVSAHHIYLFTFLARPNPGAKLEELPYSEEIVDVGWFEQEELPQPIHNGNAGRIPIAFEAWKSNGKHISIFDAT